MIKLCAFADEASPAVSGQIAAMKRNGISLLEIRGVDGTNISEITADKAREVRKMLDAEGLGVWSMGSPVGKISLADDFAPHVEMFKNILEYADILGASKIRMFSFFPIEGESRDVTLNKVLERLNTLAELTPDHIVLCHENEKQIFGETPENCIEIHKALPKVRAVFDPANFVQCGVNTLEAWELMKDYVEYMHIKDAQADHVVVPAGTGLGNIPALVKKYLAQGGQVVTMEPHLAEFAGLAALENGESHKKGESSYKNTDEAFDAGVAAFKSILAAL